jgi:hypothetical protein
LWIMMMLKEIEPSIKRKKKEQLNPKNIMR